MKEQHKDSFRTTVPNLDKIYFPDDLKCCGNCIDINIDPDEDIISCNKTLNLVSSKHLCGGWEWDTVKKKERKKF